MILRKLSVLKSPSRAPAPGTKPYHGLRSGVPLGICVCPRGCMRVCLSVHASVCICECFCRSESVWIAVPVQAWACLCFYVPLFLSVCVYLHLRLCVSVPGCVWMCRKWQQGADWLPEGRQMNGLKSQRRSWRSQEEVKAQVTVRK